MEEKPVDHPGLPTEVYHRLGKKTFWIFLLDHIHAAAVLLLIAIILFVLGGQPFVANLSRATLHGLDLGAYVFLGAWIVLALFVVTFAITLLVVWLTYANYKFALGEDALKIKRGILSREEVAIPYRQIQDVDIAQDLGFRMMGLSRIVILTAGHEDEKGDESEGILPALDADLAEWLQAELLKRTDVQRVTEVREASQDAPPKD